MYLISVSKANVKKVGWCAIFLATQAGFMPLAAAATTVAGTTPATLSVSNTGAANYVVPIQVPPGVAGMQPTLSLKYDSLSGRDIAGPGWTLDGVPYIRRCAKTQAQDGVRGGISLTSNDRFCYQGMRLVMPSGQSVAYGADQASYRTEIDSFSRVTSYGVAGAGPSYFVVEEKSGRKLFFGQTPDSQLVPAKVLSTDPTPTTVLVWYLNQIVDRNGNAINFSYKPANASAATGEILLDQISYVGGKVRVQFGYVSDPNPRTAYVAGAQTNHSMLLQSITTAQYVNGTDPTGTGTVGKSYSLGYDFFDAKGTTLADKPIGRLSSITECSATDQTASTTACFSPLKFQWAYWSSSASDHVYAAPQMVIGSGTNGALNFTESNGFSKEGVLNLRRFADINGDGRPDLIAFWNNNVYAYMSNGATGFSSTPTQIGTGFGAAMGFGAEWGLEGYILNNPIYLVDMNRDGYPDILGFAMSDLTKQTAYIAYWNSTTGQYGAPQVVRTTPIGPGSCGGLSTDDDLTNARFLADMNGDGYPDIVRLTPRGAVVSYFDPTTGINGGTGVFSADVLVGPAMAMGNDCQNMADMSSAGRNWAPNYNPTFMVDMNGDGYPDFVGVDHSGAYVALWDPVAKKFADTLTLVSSSVNCCDSNTTGVYTSLPTYLIDMNGDGYPDLVQMKSDGLYVSLWTGKTFLPAVKWTSQLSGGDWQNHPDQNPRQLIDVDGDGYPDLVGFSSAGIQVALSNGNGGFANATVWDTSGFNNGATASGNTFGRSVDTPRFIQDISGSGMPDAIGFGDKTMIWSHIGKQPGQSLQTITNGLGQNTQINYQVAQPFSSIYVGEPSASPFPLRDVTGPYYAVSIIASDDGLGGTRRKTYQYAWNRADFFRGPLGFGQITSTDQQSNTQVQQTFSPNYPTIGYLTETKTSVDGVTISDIVDTYLPEQMDTAGEYSGNYRYFNSLRRRVESRYDLNGIQLWTKTTDNLYGKTGSAPLQWGDLTSSSVVYSDGHSSSKALQYYDVDVPNWLLGRVQEITQTDTRPGQTITVTPPGDAPPTTPSAPPKPSPSDISAVMAVITSLLLDDD